MSRSYLPPLFALAAIWGASYLFIKVADRDLQPTTIMAMRMLGAAPLLIAFICLRSGTRRALGELWAARRDGLVLGVINGAVPFTLIAWGEKHIDSGVAAIANASVPIFVALLAIRFRPSERVTGLRLAGVVIGIAGVGVLTGVKPHGGWWAVVGTLAVVLASAAYAAGGLYGQLSVSRASGPVLAAATTLYGGLVLLPFGLAQLPGHVPGWKPLASVAALSLAGTAVAQLILFHMLRLHGPSRTTLVTYLMPPLALVYGATILGEPLTGGALGGLALILVGVALGSGVLRLSRRAAVEVAP